MSAQFEFDLQFQRSILRLMMVDEEFALKSYGWVEPGYFTSSFLGWIFKCFCACFNQGHGHPTDLILRDSVRRMGNPQLAGEAEAIIRLGPVSEGEYIKSRLVEFVRQAIFARAHEESAALFNEGKRDKAYDIMAHAQEQIQDVTFDKEDRSWFFDSFRDRQHKRVAEHAAHLNVGICTGIPELDNMTGGGVQPTEVWCMLAYAKRGKTTWLTNQGFNCIRANQKPVLHLSLENVTKQVENRYDALFSGELYQKVKIGELDYATQRYLEEEYSQNRRMLVIRTLNDFNINIQHIVREVRYLKAAKNFNPAMIILDYMDLGRAMGGTATASETEAQLAFARDYKRFINQEEKASWSAWQAQRPKRGTDEKEHILTTATMADCYAKARVVDAYGSLNATNTEMKENRMRVYMENHRDAAVNKVWMIENDLGRMKMASASYTYEPQDSEWT